MPMRANMATGPIDLTRDESDDDGPLTKLFPEKRIGIRTPVPLPENVRHLYPPPRGTAAYPNNHQTNAPTVQPPPPTYYSPYATRSSLNATNANPSSLSIKNTTFKVYVPVQGLSAKEGQSSEKRRKLSTAPGASVIPPQPNYNVPGQPISFNGGSLPFAQAPATALKPNSAATSYGNNSAAHPQPRAQFMPRPYADYHKVDGRQSLEANFAFRPFPVEPTGSSSITPQPPTVPAQLMEPPDTTSRMFPVASSVGLSEEENHFLIYLKEVKKLRWGDITTVFNEHFRPGRTYPKLQSTYSTKLNKRDRSKDPPTWTLPPSYKPDVVPSLPAAQVIPKPSNNRPNPPQPEPVTSVEHSSSTEHRLERPRRAVSVKDYNWAKLQSPQLQEQEDHDSVDGNSVEPPESLNSAPEVAIPIDNVPLVPYSFEKEDAVLAMSTQKNKRRTRSARKEEMLPYLSSSERFTLQNPPPNQEWDQLSSRDWQGSLVHVDFSDSEVEVIQQVLYKILKTPNEHQRRRGRKHLQKLLQSVSEPRFLHIQSEACRKLRNRDQKSVKAFLIDAQAGHLTKRPLVNRLAAARPNREYSSTPKTSITSMVSERELGSQSRRGWKAASQPVSYQMKNKIHDSLGPSFTYTGASSDVHAVAWSPDGEYFVAGAICVDDPYSMQYNKGNNLLYGDLTNGLIHELGGHSVPRPRTESGPNSTHAMYASQDPKLYSTVSSVIFSPDGRWAYSGGYDHKVCVWETRPQEDQLGFRQPRWTGAWRHKAPIDIMAINSSGLLATASKKPSMNAIKTIRMLDNDVQVIDRQNFSSQKATSNPNYNILPTALQFSPRSENLLLAGFGANVRHDGRDLSGDMCLWDVNRPKEPLNIVGSGKNVFDLAFHPRQNWFAAGCVAGPGVNRGTQSVVRLHDEVAPGKYSMRVELECKALDINDITWCPGNDYLIAAGCTSGRVYVWDIRQPDYFLRELAHAHSLMPLDDNLKREVTDTGVRFLSWGDNATRLYSGSSDGVVKVWNVATSEEETFVKDLITTDSGIMSGAFSPDKSKLVLGDINGSINVLEVGREDCSLREANKFMFIPYDERAEKEGDSDEVDQVTTAVQHNEDSGISTANELLRSGQMIQMPLGGLPVRQAVQGPNYSGPFDNNADSPFLREQALQFQLGLARPTGPQCSLPARRDGVVKVTSEEIGDSGRSLDRIADELRQAWKTPHSELVKLIPGKSRCVKCNKIARPSTSGETFCERCSFACFRCCQPLEVPPATDRLSCPHCKGVWEIGALGFESVYETNVAPNLDEIIPSLGNLTFDDDPSGEETDDYYFMQAIDRPASPPL